MIAAAGSGERLGAGGPKAFVEVAGRPLLAWSLLALAAAERSGQIVIAAPPGQEDEAARLAREVLPEGDVSVLAGGASRAESVANALAEATGELLLIHDAARPLLPPQLADRLLERLEADPGADAAIAALPLPDTVKRARAARGSGGDRGRDADGEGDAAQGSGEGGESDAQIVAETLDREWLWAAQTPQAFRIAALREASERAGLAGDLERATDEAWLIERAGGRVLLEPAPASNLKVTTPADLVVAEALLSR